MAKKSKDLESVGELALTDRPGFKNQAAQKAAARGQLLEALTAHKGAAIGRKGLLFHLLESLEHDIQSSDPAIRLPARAETLKLALSMTKDDAGQKLTDLLKGGGTVNVSFSNYFEGRAQKAIPITGQIVTE